jgi:hypothetical protein
LPATPKNATGSTTEILVALESTFKAKPADAAFRAMPYHSARIGVTQALESEPILGRGRGAQDPVPGAKDGSGQVEVPVDVRYVGLWLASMFGAPTTTIDAGVYTHVFTAGGDALQSLAFEKRFSRAGHYELVTGVQVDTLGLSIQESGAARLSASVMAAREVAATGAHVAAPSAKWALERLSNFQASIKVSDDVVANLTAAQITLANALERVPSLDGTGEPAAYDPGVFGLTGSLTARLLPGALRTAALTAVPVALEFQWRISDSKLLKIEAPRVWLPKPVSEISGPGGVEVGYDLLGAEAFDGDAALCTVTLINDVAGTDYGAAA